MMFDDSEPELEASETHVCVALIEQESLPGKVLAKIARLKGPVNWERFLLEAVSELGEDFLLKVLMKNKWAKKPLKEAQAAEDSHEPEVDIKTMSKPKMYTISAVGQLIPSGFYARRKYAPLVRFSGFWLKQYGFQVGDKILVYASKDQLIVKTGSAMDEQLGITRGGSNDD